LGLDPGLLGRRDRAAVRLLNRADVATSAQLVSLVYHRRQTAQEHLSALYRAGWLERAVLPPLTRGGAPLAFRLAPHARRRLGYPPLTRSRGGTQLRHSLNVVESVCALLRSTSDHALVQAWLTESMAAGVLSHIYPDSLLVLQHPSGSGVLCLEIDESTEHAPAIRDKLRRYAHVLRGQSRWQLLFVVGSPERARLLASLGRDEPGYPGLAGLAWAVVLGDLGAKGVGAPLVSFTAGAGRQTLASILRDQRRRTCPTPVGSDAWVELLASGGVEELDEALDW
jgi:hypothetical protein